jgi:hypothetical protein
MGPQTTSVETAIEGEGMSIRNAGEIASDAVRAAIKAERARVREIVRKLADQSQYFHVQEFVVALITALKEKP